MRRRLRGQIQHDSQGRQKFAGGDAANLPQGLDVQPAAVALIDHVGQQVSVGNDDFAGFKRWPDHFCHQLRAGRHVEEHFASPSDGQVVPVKQQIPNRLAQGRTARIATGNHRVSLVAKPLAEEVDLG